MRTCFVHIGMHKTGSTAIQTAFHGYDDGRTKMLRLKRPNHSLYMMMLFSSPAAREHARGKLGVPIEEVSSYVMSLRDTIVAQFQDSESNFVISGEEFSNFQNADYVESVRSFLSAWFDDIQIIVYLRDPVSYLRSAFQETAKGSVIAFDLDRVLPNYRKKIVNWIEIFGRNNVSAVPYDRKSFVAGSVIHDFAHRIGADVSRAGPQIGNESLRAEGFALTYAIRNSLAAGNLPQLQQARMRADLFMTLKYGHLDFDFSDDLFDAALEKQKEQIAWAEDLMNQSFPASRRAADAIVFGSHEDIIQYANHCRSGFNHWKRRHFSLSRRLRYLVRELRRGIV